MAQFKIVEQQVFTRLHEYVQAHNQAQSNLADRIRLGSLLTLKTLTQKYIKVLRIAIEDINCADSDRLPAVYTNRFEVSTLTACGKRTVYDHLEKLEAAGFTHKKFRGRQHDFSVWINPWILFGDSYERPCVVDLSTLQNPGFKLAIGPKLPPISTLERNSNVPKSGVNSVERIGDLIKGNFGAPNSLVRGHVRNFTLERAEVTTPKNTLETTDKAPGGARPGGSQAGVHLHDKGGEMALEGQTGHDAELRIPPMPSPTPRKSGADNQTYTLQKRLVLAFWETARQKLWPKDFFSPQHTKQILNMLWIDVFYSFDKCPNESNSLKLYHARIAQLEKAERYFSKKGWSAMPPLKYFSLVHYDTQKETGEKGNFHHTTLWQIADEKARETLDKQRLVDNAIQAVLTKQYPRNYAGDRSQPALYAYWKNRLSKRCSLDLLAKFDEQILLHFGLIPTEAQINLS